MISTAICLILAAIGSISLYAQDSVKTINTNRIFYDWQDSGLNCEEEVTDYWYVFRNEMDTTLKKQVRLCGGSVLHIGKRNGFDLYHQGISVPCDSVTSLLKQDSNFINVLPLIAEEKVSRNIYNNSELDYVDSARLIFKSRVIYDRVYEDAVVTFLASVVDSVEGTGVNTYVYGTREEMLVIAANDYIETVTDSEKDVLVRCKKYCFRQREKAEGHFVNSAEGYDLAGRNTCNKKSSTMLRIYGGRLYLNQKRYHKK